MMHYTFRNMNLPQHMSHQILGSPRLEKTGAPHHCHHLLIQVLQLADEHTQQTLGQMQVWVARMV
jgi:hypothetical protein